MYLERYVAQPRHIEVQVFCDTHGNAFALGERECSVQRRHQKIVEESPSPAAFFAGEAGEERRRDLYEAALRVVKKVGYVGAGTCEFIADAEGELFFLEVNARLQVEHPVTEMVTGLDLVELQLRVAAGEALPDLSQRRAERARDRGARLRRGSEQGVHPEARPDRRARRGRAAQARCSRSTLRVESGVRAGNKVTPFYDPMIAKVVAWGETRDAAIAELDRALAGTTIAPCTTNLAFLRKVLASEEFRAAGTTRSSPRSSRNALEASSRHAREDDGLHQVVVSDADASCARRARSSCRRPASTGERDDVEVLEVFVLARCRRFSAAAIALAPLFSLRHEERFEDGHAIVIVARLGERFVRRRVRRRQLEMRISARRSGAIPERMKAHRCDRVRVERAAASSASDPFSVSASAPSESPDGPMRARSDRCESEYASLSSRVWAVSSSNGVRMRDRRLRKSPTRRRGASLDA